MSTVTLDIEKKKALVPQLRFPWFENEWKNFTLKKIIIELNSGISVNSDDFPIKNDLEIGILKTSCVANGVFIEKENKKIVETEISRARLNPAKNEIIISRMNTPQLVGESGYIDKDYPSLFIPDRLWQTIVNQDFCDSRWLSYFLITEKVRDNLKSIATGTSGTMKNISKPNFLSINISIPKLAEQKKIASFLSAVDEKIQQLSRKKELLEQYKKGVMQQLFSGKLRFKDENGEDYPDWEEKKLGDIATLLKDGSHGSHKDVPDGKYYLLSAKNIRNGRINIDNDDRKISEDDFNAIYKNYNLKENDILLTIVGTIGRLAIYKGEKNISFQRSVAFFRFENAYSNYMFQLMNGNAFQKELENRKVVSAQPGIYLGDLAKISLNIPIFKEQQKIANFLSSIDAKIESTNKQITQTQMFKKGLLQKMFI